MHGAGGPHYQKPTGAALEACAAVERLAVERRAGRVIDPAKLDPLEFELLCVWEAREREHELLFRSDFSNLVVALKGRAEG